MRIRRRANGVSIPCVEPMWVRHPDQEPVNPTAAAPDQGVKEKSDRRWSIFPIRSSQFGQNQTTICISLSVDRPTAGSRGTAESPLRRGTDFMVLCDAE